MPSIASMAWINNMGQIRTVMHADKAVVEAVYTHLAGDEPPAFRGAINDVYRLAWRGRYFCIRVRRSDDLFAYETSFPKEPLAAALLNRSKLETTALDQELDRCVARLTSLPVGRGEPFVHQPKLVFYDFSRMVVPYVFTVSEWVTHTAIRGAALYEKAGAVLHELHAPRFSSFKRRLDEAWQPAAQWLSTQIDQLKHLRGVEAEVEAVENRIKQIGPQTHRFTLAHNDYHPLNWLEEGAGLKVIDWDNATIAPPEADLVKVKYWAKLDADGNYRPDHAAYEAFLRAYQTAGGQIDRAMLVVCELLWLPKIIAFEQAREAQGLETRPFPGSQQMREALKAFLHSEGLSVGHAV